MKVLGLRHEKFDFVELENFRSTKMKNFKNLKISQNSIFVDKMHDLKYPTFGVDLKYDKYFIGMSYIYGDQTLPVSNTFRLTINLEI